MANQNETTPYSAFDINTGSWKIGWPGRVARHDVVYLSPPDDPMRGMPIGNGDVGALCWCESSSIILAVNKCDLWDFAEFGRFRNWIPEQEERSTTLRHAGRVIVDFGFPVFDLFYLSDFQGRISLADASISISASGPFGDIWFRAFVGHDDGVIYCEMDSNMNENTPVVVRLERYGSRSFPHWYAQVERDPAKGLYGTESAADADGIYLWHQLSSGTFSIGCSTQAQNGLYLDRKRQHSHAASISISGEPKKKFDLHIAVTSPSKNIDPIDAAKNKLATAAKCGAMETFAIHKMSWKAFWNRSFMEYGDDYLDNLWHLNMYYANSSQRGCYPGRFINGLWGWNRDVQNWNFYFHWNQQEIYWPLNAAGHHDLLDSYLNYRFNSLIHAKEDAALDFGADGAWVSDVSEARGYNSFSETANHTPVAQIAMDFWRQYKFSGDVDFLRERALPYMLKAAQFFESLFGVRSDGKYHAQEGTGYEGWIKLTDCISELACAQALFTAVLDALEITGIDEPRSASWRRISENMAPFPTAEADDRYFNTEDGIIKYSRGYFRGDLAIGKQVLSAGFGLEEQRFLTSRIPSDTGTPIEPYNILLGLESGDNFDNQGFGISGYDGIFPNVEFSPVFPSGLIGISDMGSDMYNLSVNTAKLYSPMCMGWDPLPIVLARLGLTRESEALLASIPDRWQFFCNGFCHYGPDLIQRADSALRFRCNTVRPTTDDGQKEEFSFPGWPFRHMGMEALSVLSCAMNESLLQSHEPAIRVAPSVSESRHSRFTLHAQGGFVVSSEIESGKPLWIAVESLNGGICTITNPWPVAHIFRASVLESSTEDKIVKFATDKGGLVILASKENTISEWVTVKADYCRNDRPKRTSKHASLGLPRMF